MVINRHYSTFFGWPCECGDSLHTRLHSKTLQNTQCRNRTHVNGVGSRCLAIRRIAYTTRKPGKLGLKTPSTRRSQSPYSRTVPLSVVPIDVRYGRCATEARPPPLASPAGSLCLTSDLNRPPALFRRVQSPDLLMRLMVRSLSPSRSGVEGLCRARSV